MGLRGNYNFNKCAYYVNYWQISIWGTYTILEGILAISTRRVFIFVEIVSEALKYCSYDFVVLTPPPPQNALTPICDQLQNPVRLYWGESSTDVFRPLAHLYHNSPVAIIRIIDMCATTEGNDMASEVWKPIEEFNGEYMVSNLGRVKSLKWKKQYVLKPYKSEVGYMRVCLTSSGRQYYRYVHRLVALAFIPNPKNLQ